MTILARILTYLTLVVPLCVGLLGTMPSYADDESTTPVKPHTAPISEPNDTPDLSQAKTPMSQERMEDIVTELAGDVRGSPGSIQFVYDEISMALVSVPELNRMRIVAVVIEADEMSQEHLYAMMIANYHLALDARYALGDGMVYSTYIHPLRELSVDQIESALRQVANLVKTFGTEYTSGELSFGAQARGEEI